MSVFAKIKFLNFQDLGRRVVLTVWISRLRKLGKILFLLCQDSSGQIQSVVKDKELINSLLTKRGDLVKIWGTVCKKSENDIEIELEKFQTISVCNGKLPFIVQNNISIGEETKYRYRYLDLRREVSRKPILTKSIFLHETRKFFHRHNFTEIETPILAQCSPEGAKCFLVPSNIPNRYYTLSQSPQIFKQMLMTAGFNRYYQIAKSFRNEGARSDRQIEFCQLDVEMSFVSIKDIQKLIQRFLCQVLPRIMNTALNISFSSLTYQQVIERYHTDKPDLRDKENQLNFLWITNWPLFKYDQERKKYNSFRHPFTMMTKKHAELFLAKKISPEQILTQSFDLVCNGVEILSGSIRIHQRLLQERVLEVLGCQENVFDYFLKALDYATPPHGGFGLGVDRLLAVVLGIKNLKELLAFPKNIDGICSFTGAPDYITT